jgi:hypothetical protein
VKLTLIDTDAAVVNGLRAAFAACEMYADFLVESGLAESWGEPRAPMGNLALAWFERQKDRPGGGADGCSDLLVPVARSRRPPFSGRRASGGCSRCG